MQNLTKDAARWFGITLPCERAELKRAFREAAKRLHTDTSGGDTKDAFIDMKACYDKLIVAEVFTDVGVLPCTEEGTLLTDLGLGRKNGVTCRTCKGVGYRKDQRWRLVPKYAGAALCDVCTALQSALGCRYGCDARHVRMLMDIYLICAPCQGHGEIEAFNPVLRGWISAI